MTTKTVSLSLPRLAGTREAARDLVSDQHIPDDLTGQTIDVFCRNLASGSTSFADELVTILLSERHAAYVVLLGAPSRFVDHARDSAARRGFSGRIQT